MITANPLTGCYWMARPDSSVSGHISHPQPPPSKTNHFRETDVCQPFASFLTSGRTESTVIGYISHPHPFDSAPLRSGNNPSSKTNHFEGWGPEVCNGR